VRVHHLASAKKDGTKLVMLTAYDAVTAQILDAAGTDLLLVGDSIGNVMLGHDSTLPVQLDEMVVATRSVARATKRALVVADLPFGTYEASPEQTLASAVRLMKAGANAVKLEGGTHLFSTISQFTAAGIPVVGHLGLTPQSVHQLGGYGLQGKEGAAADKLFEEALGLERAGCCAVVLEKVPASVAARVAQSLQIPVIGIGAGSGVDGQVLVSQDMLGMEDRFTPKFLRRFAALGEEIKQAAGAYITAVKERSFPSDAESY